MLLFKCYTNKVYQENISEVYKENISYDKVYLYFLVKDMKELFFFSFFDICIVLLQGSSIRSLSIRNIIKNLYPIILLKNILFFLFMWFINLLFLFLYIFMLELLFIKLNLPTQWILGITLFFLVFRLHTFTQSQILFILGIFNPNKENEEMFLDKNEIQKIDYKNKITRLLFNQIINIRKFVYSIIFNDPNYYNEYFYGDRVYYNTLTKPNNKRFFYGIFNFIYKFTVPHTIYLLLNPYGFKMFFLRILLYSLLTTLRFFFLVNLIIFLSSRIVYT